MSEGNVELVRTLLSTFDRADYEAALEALDPEIEWQVPSGVAIGQQVYRGRDEVQKGFAEWLGMQIGRGRGSGAEVRLATFSVFTLRDGKVTRHRSYDDRTEALEAAGLRR